MIKGTKVYSIRLSGDEQHALDAAVAAAKISQSDYMRLAVLQAIAADEVLQTARKVHEDAMRQMQQVHQDAMEHARQEHERTMRVLAAIEAKQLAMLDQRVRQITEIAIEAGAQLSTPPRSG